MDNTIPSYGLPGIQEIIVIIFILGLNIPWIWSIVHCAKNKNLSDSDRTAGLLIIVLLHILGTIIYLCVYRKKNSAAPEQNSATPGPPPIRGREQ